MIDWLRIQYLNFVGSGDAALTVPAMDGALRPNRALDSCSSSFVVNRPDNICVSRDDFIFSSGNTLLRLQRSADGFAATPLLTAPSLITAVATCDDQLAISVEGVIDVIRAGQTRKRIETLGGTRIFCPTALTFLDGDRLAVCLGSTAHQTEDWQKDLLLRGATGSVWMVDIASGAATQLANGLAFPNGVLVIEDGNALIVSESLKHRLVRLDARQSSRPEPVLSDLPGYPARLSAGIAGESWLTIYAPRNQLVEFVMREPEYRDAMMSQLMPEYWIAPRLSARASFLAPLQGGAVRQMGMLKPWAPTFSFGLVVRLDAELVPRLSFGSRADGVRHGIKSCALQGSILAIACTGGDEIIFLEVEK